MDAEDTRPQGDRRDPERPPRPGALRVARIAGIPVHLTASWILLAAVLVIGYGPLLDRDRPGPAGYLLGLSIVVSLLITVLLHELGHAIAARRYRVGVRGITLELLGGFTELDGDAPNPRSEAVIALAGPAVSVLLAAAGFALVPVTQRGTVAGDLVLQLAATNAIVAVFNILPGLPLDGGRALRAVLWHLTRDPLRADVIAGWCGRVIAVATLATGLILYRQGRWIGLLGVVFLIMIAVTLWTGATAAIRGATVRARLPRLRAGTLARPLYLVRTGTPLAEALRQRDEPAAGDRAVLGVANSAGHVIALVDGRDVARIPPERRPWVDVDAAARPVTDEQRITAAATGADVLAKLQANPDHDLLVTVGEDIVGVLRITDVVTMLESGEPPP